MRPVFAAVAGFVELGNAHAVRVGRTVLGLDVHRHLAEVEVRTDPGRGSDAGLAEHLADQFAGELVGREPVGLEVGGGVDEDLVDGIDVDIFRSDVAQVHAVDAPADFDVVGHLRRGDDVVQLQGGVGEQGGVFVGFAPETPSGGFPAPLRVDFGDRLDHFEQAGPAADAVGLQGRGDRQADGLVRARGIRHHQMRIQGIQAPVHALHGGIEGLQVDGYVDAVFHYTKIVIIFA